MPYTTFHVNSSPDPDSTVNAAYPKDLGSHEQLNEYARGCLAAGQFDRAARYFHDSLDVRETVRALLGAAIAESMLGEMREVRRLVEQALEREIDSAPVLVDFATLCLRIGEPRLALEAADQALFIDPDCFEAFDLLRKARLIRDQETAEYRSFRIGTPQREQDEARADELQGDFRQLVRSGALFLAQGAFSKAYGVFMAAEDIEPDIAPVAALGLGISSHLTGRSAYAALCCRSALQGDIDDPDILLDLARLCLRMGDEERAFQAAGLAVALDPSDVEIAGLYIELQKLMGEGDSFDLPDVPD